MLFLGGADDAWWAGLVWDPRTWVGIDERCRVALCESPPAPLAARPGEWKVERAQEPRQEKFPFQKAGANFILFFTASIRRTDDDTLPSKRSSVCRWGSVPWSSPVRHGHNARVG